MSEKPEGDKGRTGQTPTPPYPMRLQKFLARAGVASRRGSENLMTAGRVTVNGEVRADLGCKVDPKVDVVCVDGRRVELADGSVYLMLNKPAGYLTTMSDPYDRPCVASLVPTDRYPGLFPVGRLDMDTTGLLLFTTDGEMGQRLLHPKHHVPKTYRAVVAGVPSESELDRLRRGITLDDGPCQPAEVALEKAWAPKAGRSGKKKADRGSSRVSITIREGRKRQVKRMFLAIHHEVLHLHRDKFGPLKLGKLQEGNWRLLSDEEVAALKDATAQ
ncbi:MAG: pseudouridine synthase [Coriobacteriales bacterium]|jgi:23S rRNA pseudouridine2605 synthase